MCVILHQKYYKEDAKVINHHFPQPFFSVVDGMVFRIHGHDLFYISAKSI